MDVGKSYSGCTVAERNRNRLSRPPTVRDDLRNPNRRGFAAVSTASRRIKLPELRPPQRTCKSQRGSEKWGELDVGAPFINELVFNGGQSVYNYGRTHYYITPFTFVVNRFDGTMITSSLFPQFE